MSFNKRYYSIEKIINFYIGNGFDSFDRWIINPDARISEDELSFYFVEEYLSLETDQRILLADAICESVDFTGDLLKCLRVIKNERNKDSHKEGIENYKNLFFEKWGDFAEKYKHILENNGK